MNNVLKERLIDVLYKWAVDNIPDKIPDKLVDKLKVNSGVIMWKEDPPKDFDLGYIAGWQECRRVIMVNILRSLGVVKQKEE